mmetsp:Transcript_18188/g.50921  ORF Transcript_18188/g.50921 Transcript_18188/m.50921 type:complete len:120 (+) Transcript_18188:226-585(+)
MASLGSRRWCMGGTTFDREANEKRDRADALRKLRRFGDKAFKRRFKVSRGTFARLVVLIRNMVELDGVGVCTAERSSRSHIPAELQLAATLRWLAGASYMCQEDNYALGMSSFLRAYGG